MCDPSHVKVARCTTPDVNEIGVLRAVRRFPQGLCDDVLRAVRQVSGGSQDGV